MTEDRVLRIEDTAESERSKKEYQFYLSKLSMTERGFYFLILMMMYDGKADFESWESTDKAMKRVFRWLLRKKYVKKSLAGIYEITPKGKKFYEKMKVRIPYMEPFVIKMMNEGLDHD